jgi:hypothetical protein
MIMTVIAEIFAGLGSGVLDGLGSLAVKLRTAITGSEAITGEKQGELLLLAAQVEAIKQTADFELQKAQIAINAEDAKSGSNYRGGWRPMAGWGCVFAVVIYPIMQVLLPWMIGVAGVVLGKDPHLLPILPSIPLGDSSNLLWALLGFGGLRSFDKLKGIQ